MRQAEVFSHFTGDAEGDDAPARGRKRGKRTELDDINRRRERLTEAAEDEKIMKSTLSSANFRQA